MKKHHLWGRKKPGPYTKLGNSIFDGAANGASAAGGAAATATGSMLEFGQAAGGAMGNAGNKMIDGAGEFNEWAQENHARFDHTDEISDEDRPFTKGDG